MRKIFTMDKIVGPNESIIQWFHRTKSCIVKHLLSDHCIMYLCIMHFNTYIIHARLITFESI